MEWMGAWQLIGWVQTISTERESSLTLVDSLLLSQIGWMASPMIQTERKIVSLLTVPRWLANSFAINEEHKNFIKSFIYKLRIWDTGLGSSLKIGIMKQIQFYFYIFRNTNGWIWTAPTPSMVQSPTMQFVREFHQHFKIE